MAEEQKPGNRMFEFGEARPAEEHPAPGRGSAPLDSQGLAYSSPAAPARTSPAVFVVLIALVILAGVSVYWGVAARRELTDTTAKQAEQLNVLTHRLDASDERYAQLRGQFEVTSERLGLTQQELGRARQLASNIEKQQQATVSQLNQAIAQKASAADMSKMQSDASAKFGAVDGSLSDINKRLGDTNDALNGAKGELSGAIAKTHDELVALAHRTDRDYFEFNLGERGARQKIGGVTLELAKTNLRKNLYTMNLYFDDKRTVRKDQALDSPVQFYVEGAPGALEFVVNKINKRSVRGYLSAPKGFLSGVPNVLTARPGA